MSFVHLKVIEFETVKPDEQPVTKKKDKQKQICMNSLFILYTQQKNSQIFTRKYDILKLLISALFFQIYKRKAGN